MEIQFFWLSKTTQKKKNTNKKCFLIGIFLPLIFDKNNTFDKKAQEVVRKLQHIIDRISFVIQLFEIELTLY